MSFHHKQPMGAFRRGLTISPFQIPLLAYLFFEGVMIAPSVPELATEMQVPVWALWNFVGVLIVGAGLATLARFGTSERIEEFGLWLTALAVMIAVGIQVAAHQYGLGDEVAIGLGCLLRIRTLRKSRRAEHVAVEIASENNGETH